MFSVLNNTQHQTRCHAYHKFQRVCLFMSFLYNYNMCTGWLIPLASDISFVLFNAGSDYVLKKGPPTFPRRVWNVIPQVTIEHIIVNLHTPLPVVKRAHFMCLVQHLLAAAAVVESPSACHCYLTGLFKAIVFVGLDLVTCDLLRSPILLDRREQTKRGLAKPDAFQASQASGRLILRNTFIEVEAKLFPQEITIQGIHGIHVL